MERQDTMQKIAFYGAKSLALGMYEAVHLLYPKIMCIGFIVTSLDGNPSMLAGKKVWELNDLRNTLSQAEKDALQILIAVPEDIQPAIESHLCKNNFKNYICMDSRKEAKLMEQYFAKKGEFLPLHREDLRVPSLCVYQAKFYGDKQLKREHKLPKWVIPIQVGAAISTEKICRQQDDQGENISEKNVNYCELTGLYWLWKNRLQTREKINDTIPGGIADYYGLFHYRRLLDVSDEDVLRMKERDVDVVLPFPTLHEPDISEHYARYVKESDWKAMRQALLELKPEYSKALERILKQPYFYNYNIIIARKEVLADYCAWLFPILERTEELSVPKGWERADRYIGYLGESLMTLYFLYHQKDFRIFHAGRLMLT